ncbi:MULTISPECIES: hypothetical protein [unclassified Chelatococcus]|uniref:hypothetical protein n=1 Tax=unclassified Chelatococcus TaxID=2638111 RepID=UPI001BCD9BE3|nr:MULTISPECIES: hypothetical protein [unclassified Chelatococcus]MBS7737791.1 hypothetical protein [Chelatococcus sp. HY11]MCO5079247.1 hypothetical protein [Chelatococcus sp.]CAH1665905.1 conserved hypothetical protein [Hyphomicrobiales bacterium]CAH1681028.1 conserved hypothetical protein [Hyphomicrobiales bacterium]
MITVTHQTTLVDGIEKVVITPSTQDLESGDWVREIRVFTGPEGEDGIPTTVLRLQGASREKIDLTAPVQTF